MSREPGFTTEIQDIDENKVRLTSLDDLDPYQPPDEDNVQ